MRIVRDIMQTDLISVRPEATVHELVQLLDEEGISGVPVLDSAKKLRGVVSRTDVVRHVARAPELPTPQAFWEGLATGEDEGDLYFLAPETSAMVLPSSRLDHPDLEDVTVEEIMTPVAFSVDPEMLIWELAAYLVRGRIHRALVTEEDRLLGIVTAFDILTVVAGDAGG
jgi:CBS domain-containing protein